MAGTQGKRPTSGAPKKKITKQAVKKSVTKAAVSVSRKKTSRAKKPSVAVVVLSGSTPLRRNKAAELVAEELQLDLEKVNLSSVVGRRAGETEKNINRVFDEAERSGSILFFEGADTLFGKHRAGTAGVSYYADAGRPIYCNASRIIRAWSSSQRMGKAGSIKRCLDKRGCP